MNDLKKIGLDAVPAIGLGTWGIGGKSMPDHSKDREWIDAIRYAIDNGMWLIDTAEFYAQGHAEELVGEAIKKYKRDEVFIISKVWYTHLEREQVLEAAERSLRRLSLTYIDLYLIHWPNERIPLRETLSAMQELIDKGKIRYAGVSNFDLRLLSRAREEMPRSDIVADEVKYSLWHREPEKDLLQYCEKEKIALIAYTPTEKGSLANEKFLAEIGKKYGKTAVQVALNWLIYREPVIAIPKAEKLEHIIEDAGAMGWRLKPEDYKVIADRFNF
ncbi:MAG: aldo/keto reductase [Conexivisphaerales archaeon]|nr:aldo/keto reductase [Conexivisphaerales archaeon]